MSCPGTRDTKCSNSVVPVWHQKVLLEPDVSHSHYAMPRNLIHSCTCTEMQDEGLSIWKSPIHTAASNGWSKKQFCKRTSLVLHPWALPLQHLSSSFVNILNATTIIEGQRSKTGPVLSLKNLWPGFVTPEPVFWLCWALKCLNLSPNNTDIMIIMWYYTSTTRHWMAGPFWSLIFFGSSWSSLSPGHLASQSLTSPGYQP